MGFWEEAGNLMVKGYKLAEEKAGDFQEKVEKHVKHYEKFSDNDLKRMLKSNASDRARVFAIAKVLRDRGY